MTSTWIMYSFLGQYFICAVICLAEKNWPRALYWFSAGLLTIAVLWGTNGK